MPSAPELTTKQITRVSKCLTGTRNEHRDRALFFTLLYSGMRVNEPLKLKVKDVVVADGAIKDSAIIDNTKNGRSRRVYFVEGLHTHLIAYLNDRITPRLGGIERSLSIIMEECLFPSSQSKGKSMSVVNAGRIIKSAFLNAGLDSSFSSHSCRRSTALFLRRGMGDGSLGVDFEVIREILGHSDVRQTQTYFASSTIEAKTALGGLKF